MFVLSPWQDRIVRGDSIIGMKNVSLYAFGGIKGEVVTILQIISDIVIICWIYNRVNEVNIRCKLSVIHDESRNILACLAGSSRI